MWNCSPNRLRRGGRVWQALHCMSYWRANAGIASTDRTSTYANSIPARTVAKNARRNMPLPFAGRHGDTPSRATWQRTAKRRASSDQESGVQQKERRRLGGRPIHDRHEALAAEGCPRIERPLDEQRDRRGQRVRGVDDGLTRGGVKRLARVVRVGGVVLIYRGHGHRDVSVRGKRTDMTQDRKDGCYDEEQPERRPGHGGRVHAVLRVVNPPTPRVLTRRARSDTRARR